MNETLNGYLKMTNCKIKLMFALLNALLTADFVRARPMNTTDLRNITVNTGDIEIPIVPINDTLIVAISDDMEEDKELINESDENIEENNEHTVDNNNENIDDNKEHTDEKHENIEDNKNKKPQQETVEQTNKNSKTSIDDIVNAEQGRDELILSKNNLKEQNVLEISKEDSDSLDRQLNVSSSVLEDIIDAETGREESMTDILFKSEAEFIEDDPKFEFLIANKVNLSQAVNVVGDVRVGKNSSGMTEESSDVLNKVDYVELVAVMPPTVISQNFSKQILNITEHEVDNDLAPDTFLSLFSGFTDVQTLFLACFATLVPLVIALLATLLIRCMCHRCCRCKKKSEVSSVSDSSEQKQDSSSHQQLKSIPEATSDADEDHVEDEALATNNGSIITMTLKNNHLIVETEELADMPNKNGRETKLKYSPDNEGVFIVEVQQSGTYRPTIAPIASPQHDPQISTNQALIHRVPDESDTSESKTIYEVDENSDNSGKFDKARALALSNTGLSISDLSMTSVGSQSYYNSSYSYGNQTGYEQGPFGYPIYPGYEIPLENFGNEIIHDNSKEPLICKTPTELVKPIVTSAIFKQDSIIGNDAFQVPGYCMEGSTDGPLLSDVQAREVSLHQLHDKKILGNGHANEVAQTPKIHRADSLPVQIEVEPIKILKTDNDGVKNEMETIPEVTSPVKEYIFKGKRASLPIIRTKMYDPVKEVLVPTGSPKFDVFGNTTSLVDNGNGPPMITITEEVEVKTDNGNSS